MLTTIIVFILVFALAVLVHELGHFISAKRSGIRVDEFGIGFPPRIFGVKRRETLYSINLLPLGGFVKIHGEDGKKKSDLAPKRAFYNRPVSTRAKILVAGVLMNFLLAAVLLSFAHWIGLPQIVEDQKANLKEAKVQILQVAFDSPADMAGIKIGDTIRGFQEIKELQLFVDQNKGKEIVLNIERGDQTFATSLIPRQDHPDDQGPLGIALAKTAIVSYPWHRALYLGFVSTISLTIAITMAFGSILWNLITTGELAMEIAGPVGIFSLTGQVAQLGFIYILQFTALLNINLAILNILPFPALDGGRLLFLGIEKIKGSPISQKVERLAHTAGFAILILLMMAVTWRDILRFF